jgi:transposase
MDLFHLYYEMLDLKSPWNVKDIIYKKELEKICVILDYKKGVPFPCPQCNKSMPIYDHTRLRIWRHLDTCQLQTYIHAKLPRINCVKHGIQQIEPSWSIKHSRFTIQMEKYISLLIDNVETTNKVVAITAIGWNVILGVKKRALQQLK